MSNIERKYAYYDEGVLPAEGEYGITYLTLYSSGSGNVYDGWIYDPENKIPVSSIERTFGFRNPDYTQYCWDDEVVVDLSNAQNREESSELEQGRLWSFNTNVSSRPIILEDIDITGLTESEREAKATTVLFCAIPLVKDAYIQAAVEVQMKVNLSENNTDGNVRVEAFYILNDESDRTVRPHPIHTFAVTKQNQRVTLPLWYVNPALKHEVSNYIGVKLICTGGTAEIGISDDPEYGDAMITLTSAGLTGDKIDPGKPVYIELFGLEEVPMNYHFKPSDYTVLCTYDTGEIYDVTNLSAFSMEIGEKFVEPVTLLQATYCGLHASMQVRLGMIDYIEIIGKDTFYDSYTLDISDFTVMAYLDNGEMYDITAECEFSPAMGTTIIADTTLTATYIDDHSTTVQTFTDSMDIEAIPVVMTRTGSFGEDGLIYTLYNDRCIRITGNANVAVEISGGLYVEKYHEVVQIPSDIVSYLVSNNYTGVLVWDAEGEIGGMKLNRATGGNNISTISGFKDVVVKPYYVRQRQSRDYNPIVVNFAGNSYVTPYMLEFLLNVEYDPGELTNTPICISKETTGTPVMDSAFYGCTSIQDVHFLKNLDMSNTWTVGGMFRECTALEDISGIKGWRFSSKANNFSQMFYKCSSLTSAKELSLWDMSYANNLNSMFARTGLKNLVGIGSWKNIGENSDYSVNVTNMFSKSDIDDLIGLTDTFFTGKVTDLTRMFQDCTHLKTLQHGYSEAGRLFDMSNVRNMSWMFNGCTELEDISAAADWDVSNVTNMLGMFDKCYKLVLGRTVNYLTRWNPYNCDNFLAMFRADVNTSYMQWNDVNVDISIYWDEDYFTKEMLFLVQQNSESVSVPVIEAVHPSAWSTSVPYPLLPAPPEGWTWEVTKGGMFHGFDFFLIKIENSRIVGIRDNESPRFKIPTFYKNILYRSLINQIPVW